MRQYVKYIFLAFSIFILYLVFHGLGLDHNLKLIQLIMQISILLVLIRYLYSENKFSLDNPHLITSIILLGCIMRIGYTLYTHCNVRQHDIGDLIPDGYGHASYILKLMLYHQLPNTNQIQFYHPPLFHILGALTSSAVNSLLGHTDYDCFVDAAKLVSCFASCATLLLCATFCEELELKRSSKVLALSIIAFSPALIIIGGTVNNDSLVTFFMVAAVVYTYRWCKQQSYKNTIILAFLFGMGMMTKTSMAIIALFTAIIMLSVFLRSVTNNIKDTFSLILKFGCFGLISLPLGLWFTIRNYILFHQPLGYVVRIPETERIFCGDEPFFQRFIKIDITNLLATPFAHPWDDINYPVYIIKSSLFGEFEFNIPLWIPVILVFLNIILILCSLWALFSLIINRDKYKKLVFRGVVGLWALTIISNIYFNIQYPYGCTMDFRYMFLSLITGALFIGLTYKEHADSLMTNNLVFQKINDFYQNIVPFTILLFSFFSSLLFCFMN